MQEGLKREELTRQHYRDTNGCVWEEKEKKKGSRKGSLRGARSEEGCQAPSLLEFHSDFTTGRRNDRNTHVTHSI
jgi:hypothetical protein